MSDSSMRLTAMIILPVSKEFSSENALAFGTTSLMNSLVTASDSNLLAYLTVALKIVDAYCSLLFNEGATLNSAICDYENIMTSTGFCQSKAKSCRRLVGILTIRFLSP